MRKILCLQSGRLDWIRCAYLLIVKGIGLCFHGYTFAVYDSYICSVFFSPRLNLSVHAFVHILLTTSPFSSEKDLICR